MSACMYCLYNVRLDGSGRASVRNHKHLRQVRGTSATRPLSVCVCEIQPAVSRSPSHLRFHLTPLQQSTRPQWQQKTLHWHLYYVTLLV
ncbi:hypothetical protein SK128_023588 [Halocaridina rubra]|uniref:Uncharacterized protein n=1 Tax=Halocaridina rubra TaxID=373956 RepID=A0AAN8XGG4_HALRR